MNNKNFTGTHHSLHPHLPSHESHLTTHDPRPTIHDSRLTCIFAPMFTNDDLQTRWWTLEANLVERFGKKPDLETILFLIGMQETGIIKEKITKEQKQDLMHVAVCTLLTPSGYYEMERKDDEGWPHFRQLKPMPDMNPVEQENFLKDHVLLYFEEHKL